MTYWPGTNTPKSTNNAFNWRAEKSKITQQIDFVHTNNAKRNNLGQTESRFFTTYSRAKPSVQG